MFFSFGSGLMGKRTGIVFNDGINDFSMLRFKNQFGLPASTANLLQPQRRSLSSMSPTIITDKDKNVRMVIGAAGGTKIATSVSTVSHFSKTLIHMYIIIISKNRL